MEKIKGCRLLGLLAVFLILLFLIPLSRLCRTFYWSPNLKKLVTLVKIDDSFHEPENFNILTF